MKYRLIFILLTFFNQVAMANDAKIIEQASKLNNCTPAGQVEKKYYYLKVLTKWHIKSEIKDSSAMMFYCEKEKDYGDFIYDYFIVVIVSDKDHPWSECPSTISNDEFGTPLNFILDGLTVTGDHQFYFNCINKKWDVRVND